MEVFMGTVQSFAFPFAPRGWMSCKGQIVSISQSNALFALIGTTYGGDGERTFQLPNVSGRTIVGDGVLPGGRQYYPGEIGGQESVTLTDQNLPRHTHGLTASSGPATSAVPGPNMVLAAANGSDPGTGNAVNVNIYAPVGSPVALAPSAVGLSGMSQPVGLRSPYLVLNYCICVQGSFPSRN